MNKNLFIELFLVIVIMMLMYFIVTITTSEFTYTISPIDNKSYMVHDVDDKKDASELLSIVKDKIRVLREHFANSDNVREYDSFRPYIKQFCERSKEIELYENIPDGKNTSFTVNKGEEMALCLRSIRTKNLHDINLIMYVVLHELSHIACPQEHHTPLFKEIFKFFIVTAANLGLYRITDYENFPEEYCGIPINESLVR